MQTKAISMDDETHAKQVQKWFRDIFITLSKNTLTDETRAKQRQEWGSSAEPQRVPAIRCGGWRTPFLHRPVSRDAEIRAQIERQYAEEQRQYAEEQSRKLAAALANDGLTCPHCHKQTKEMRFLDQGPWSYFICRLCSRSFDHEQYAMRSSGWSCTAKTPQRKRRGHAEVGLG